MSYLARLKRLDDAKNFTHTPETVLPKLTEPGCVSCVSSIPAHIEKIHAAIDGEKVVTESTSTTAEPITDMPAKPLASFQADSDVDRNIVTMCPDCQHFARPGLSAGYCSGRDDLPLAYGDNHPLRRLPADRGASCDQWQASE